MRMNGEPAHVADVLARRGPARRRGVADPMSSYHDALRRAKRDLLAEVKRRHESGETFQEIGARLGVTRQRAHQLYQEAVKR